MYEASARRRTSGRASRASWLEGRAGHLEMAEWLEVTGRGLKRKQVGTQRTLRTYRAFVACRTQLLVLKCALRTLSDSARENGSDNACSQHPGQTRHYSPIMNIRSSTVWVFRAVVTNYHKLRGLTQQKYSASQLQLLKVLNDGIDGATLPLKARGGNAPLLLLASGASSASCQSLACVCITPDLSFCLHMAIIPVSLSSSSFFL